MSSKTQSSRAALTQSVPRRLIYFKGHSKVPNSALVTRVCKNYETISTSLQGELASRTLWNLYNLHACRGALTSSPTPSLVLSASMSGPHHYFGWINPREHHTISFSDGMPVWYSAEPSDNQSANALALSTSDVYSLRNYAWIPGHHLDSHDFRAFKIDVSERLSHTGDTHVNEAGEEVRMSPRKRKTIWDCDASELAADSAPAAAAAGGGGGGGVICDAQDDEAHCEAQRDSLFKDPGVLLAPEQRIRIPILKNAHLYDLSSFAAQLCRNEEPFAFNRRLVDKYKHAQHKLRVVTYHYGPGYVADYLMKGNGLFIERHHFIQAITPMSASCGGYVVLGRNQPSDLMRAAFQDNADVIIDLSRALSLTDSLHEVEPVTVEYRNTGSIYKSLDCFRSPITFTFTLSLPSLMSFPSSVTFTATLLNASGDKRSRPHGPFKLDQTVVWKDHLPAPGLYSMRVMACSCGVAEDQVVANIPVRVVPSRSQSLELIGVEIPFGYTLLVDAMAIHGDSTLHGTFMMAMTGNHSAMATADTVFLKHVSDDGVMHNVEFQASGECVTPKAEDVKGAGPELDLMMTSDMKPLSALRHEDEAMRRACIDTVRADQQALREKSFLEKLNPISYLKPLVWQPAIATFSGGNYKTLGSTLPE